MVQFDATKVSSVSVICNVKSMSLELGRKTTLSHMELETLNLRPFRQTAQRLWRKRIHYYGSGKSAGPVVGVLPLSTILTIIHGTAVLFRL